MAKEITVHLPAGEALSLSTDAVSSGTYARIAQPGDSTSYGVTALAASSSATVGPFNEERDYLLVMTSGDISYSKAAAGVIDGLTSTATELNLLDGVTATTAELNYVDGVSSALQTQLDAKAPNTVTSNVGTAATNVSAAEYGDGYQHTTVLTVTNAILPTITGGGNQSTGVLLYTLPAGACVIDKAYMSLAIQQQDGNITADTPDGGLGTTQASVAGASLLAAGAATENVLTGQTFDDCDGTAEVKTVANQILVIESGDNHTVYFNVADTWAASGDTGPLVSGTVVLHWQFIA